MIARIPRVRACDKFEAPPANEDQHFCAACTMNRSMHRRFANVECSQCGRSFGPGNAGYSHCDQHGGAL